MWFHVHSDLLACTCTDLITQQLRALSFYNYNSSIKLCNAALIKPDVVKVFSCSLCSQSYCSKANRYNDSPLHPTAEEDAMVCGLCFISGTGRRNLLLDWYANSLPAVPESIFLEKEEPPRIISEQRLALNSSIQLCQQETGRLDGMRLKFRLVFPPASATHAEKPTGLFGSGDRAGLLVASESLPVASQVIFSSELSILSFQTGKSEQHCSRKEISFICAPLQQEEGDSWLDHTSGWLIYILLDIWDS